MVSSCERLVPLPKVADSTDGRFVTPSLAAGPSLSVTDPINFLGHDPADATGNTRSNAANPLADLDVQGYVVTASLV